MAETTWQFESTASVTFRTSYTSVVNAGLDPNIIYFASNNPGGCAIIDGIALEPELPEYLRVEEGL